MAGRMAVGRFDDAYAQMLQEFADQIGERSASYGQAARSVREEIVRCVWFGGHFPSEGLVTDDGRRIEVLSPGWWNVEGGPDFLRAEFLLEGTGRVVGDVEVHTVASAWYAHGHHQQPEYNDVALHVVMWNDRDEPTVTAQNGRPVAQLTLSKAVDEDLEELVEVIDPEAESRQPPWPAVEGKYCGRAGREGQIDPDWLGRLLDAAGDHRILTRAREAAELLANHPADQILYERLAEALGYKNNRMPFLQLAGLLPIDLFRRMVPVGARLEETSAMLEAAFFITGGFLDGQPPAQPEGANKADDETAAYCQGLREAWKRFSQDPAPARLSRDHWSFKGTRPVNYPDRRIAALARLCAEHLHEGLFGHFLLVVNTSRPRGRQRPDTALRRALLDNFTALSHPYWSYRYSLGGKRLASPRALVGTERATAIVADVLLPLLLAHARREEDGALDQKLHDLWRGMPLRQDNTITRRMKQAMFAGEAEARRVVNSARRQQGLHQVYRDFCRSDGGCARCVVYLAHRAGRGLPVG